MNSSSNDVQYVGAALSRIGRVTPESVTLNIVVEEVSVTSSKLPEPLRVRREYGEVVPMPILPF